ncbi:hypothetical protein NPX13_g7497 [Xylaria arbuscula]|uniref:Uncharacterized protein n=1 Tax=Xylaria arbuscula TaxID=114810 RepID=A0A9W8NA82_9PEZI|nr:hypothetical protein NPX13_g7497 [Xylaria arbuscula]
MAMLRWPAPAVLRLRAHGRARRRGCRNHRLGQTATTAAAASRWERKFEGKERSVDTRWWERTTTANFISQKSKLTAGAG